MDVKSQLTELISALRAETEADSVSPERVGYVLQRMVDLFPSASMQLNAIKGYVAIGSVDDLPAEPTDEQQQKGWLLGTVLYVYVGEGGDTLGGKWQSADLKGGKGDKGDNGVHLGDVALVNDLKTGGEESALTAEMGKRIAELSQIIATRQSVSPQSVLTESYVDSSGEIKASGTATTTVAYYPIDGNPLSVIIGKTANSATRVLSLAEDDTQTTGLVALTEKMGDGAAYAPSELLSYSPKFRYLVVCYNNSADNSIILNKGAISFAQLASLLYLSREYSADFDDSDCLIDKTYINYTTGAEAASDYWQSTDFIEIPSDVQWYNYLATYVGNSKNSGFAFYDSNKQFISGIHHVSNMQYSGAIPDNARYVRFCRFKAQGASTTMSLYSVGALGFKAWLEAAVSRQDEVVLKLSKDITKTYTTDDCVINGKFIHRGTGEAMNNSSFICSDFIETLGKTIVVTSSWAAAGVSGFCFYGSEKQYISGYSVTQVTDAVYLIPENAKYLRFTSKPGETNTFTMSLSGVDGLIYLIEHIDTETEQQPKERHILMVGNSFTMHACEYLQTICNNLGVSNITLQYIYTSGASLKTYAESLSTTRSLTTAVDGGNPFGGGTLPNIFKGNWDIIVFQQSSNDSPNYDTYSPYLRQLIDCALENCPNKDLQIMFNMTWAYSDDDGTMWQGILDANKQLRDDYGHIVRATIASGTAVANIRRSLDVSLSYDNHHLSPGVGRYVAGCILYTSLIMPYSGVSIYDDTTVKDVSGDSTAGAVSVTNENRLICQQAVMDAYIDPWSDYDTAVDPKPTAGSSKPVSSGGVYQALQGKQDTLVSGESIKTVNGVSLLGGGDVTIAEVNSVSISERDFSVSDSIVYTNRCALIKKIPYQYDEILVKFTNNSPLYKFGIHVYDSFNNRLFQTAWLTSPNSYYFEIDSKNGAYIAIIAANNNQTTQIYYNDDILSDVIFDCRILGVTQDKEKNTCVGRPCFEPIAHRGFHNLSVPENSLDAFRIAAEMGYLYCETDVHLTSDGVVVICHDKTINKTYRNASDYSVIGSTIDITENTYQDLYDNYVQISSVKKYRKPMPTLKDFLVLCRDMGIKPLIEIKDDVDALTLATFTIAKKILGTDFGLIGYPYSQIDYARTLSDKILCGYIGSTSILNTTNTRSGESRNNDMNIWMPYNHGTLELSDEIIESYKENGVKLMSYTDNDEQFSKHSILGYNYAMTNSVSPIIQKSSGFVVTSDNGWFDFDFVGCTLFDNTNPTENSLNPFYIKSVKMDEGDCIKVPIGNTNIRCLFAIYSVIEYKGLFEIKIGSNVTTIESEKLTRHTFGKLLNLDNQKLNSFLEVTAKQDGGLINDIIFNAVPYYITVTSK